MAEYKQSESWWTEDDLLSLHLDRIRDGKFVDPALTVEGMPGCCTACVVSNLYHATPEKLADAETKAKTWQQHCMVATISTHQKNAGVDAKLIEAGWTLVHTFKSKPYGGGEVFMFVKNLDCPKCEVERELDRKIAELQGKK